VESKHDDEKSDCSLGEQMVLILRRDFMNPNIEIVLQYLTALFYLNQWPDVYMMYFRLLPATQRHTAYLIRDV